MKLVEVGGYEMFREMEERWMRRLMMSPVIIDCKNLFGEEGEIVYLGIGKGD